MAGTVRVNGRSAHKPSDIVRDTDQVELLAPEKYVSRGGYKLEHALQHFRLNVTGLTVIDLGASTGGFTDCLLQAGAAQVIAVDVGQGQLAWKLRQDARVLVMDKTNARTLTPEKLPVFISEFQLPTSIKSKPETRNPKLVDLAVIDCSFISLTKILPVALQLVHPGGRIVALIKPQFEAGKIEVDKGEGVITDPAIHERVLRELQDFVSAIDGAAWHGVTQSPLLGPAGNKEFLALIEKNP